MVFSSYCKDVLSTEQLLSIKPFRPALANDGYKSFKLLWYIYTFYKTNKHSPNKANSTNNSPTLIKPFWVYKSKKINGFP